MLGLAPPEVILSPVGSVLNQWSVAVMSPRFHVSLSRMSVCTVWNLSVMCEHRLQIGRKMTYSLWNDGGVGTMYSSLGSG